jgi:hypothetical protein
MGWKGRGVRKITERTDQKNVDQKRVILRKSERGMLMK